jgi:multicomponent Na+:H+ antiporter subunit C
MSVAYALLVGVLFAIAFHLLQRDSIVDDVFGLVVLNHAANLLVFGAGRLHRGAAPVLEADNQVVTDPLPQALVLTAIVIGFGTVAFATVLLARLYRSIHTDDVQALAKETDE